MTYFLIYNANDAAHYATERGDILDVMTDGTYMSLWEPPTGFLWERNPDGSLAKIDVLHIPELSRDGTLETLARRILRSKPLRDINNKMEYRAVRRGPTWELQRRDGWERHVEEEEDPDERPIRRNPPNRGPGGRGGG